jgi:hypothetical protein
LLDAWVPALNSLCSLFVCCAGLHTTLVRDTFDLLLQLVLGESGRAEELLRQSKMRWRLLAVNFRVMNKLVHPDLEHLVTWADHLHKWLQESGGEPAERPRGQVEPEEERGSAGTQ